MPSLLPAAVEKSFRDKKKKSSSSSGNHHHHQDSNGNVEQQLQDPSRPHFLNAMALVQVPAWLLSNEGVQVIRVAANGKTEAEQLRVSRDKFTVVLCSPSNNSNGGSRRLFSGSLFGRSNSNSSTNSQNSNSSVVVVVDIGEMDRIQRGQSTQQFEKAKNRKNLLLLNRFDSNRSIKNLNKNSDISLTSASDAADDTRSLASFSVTSAMSESQLQQHRLDPERSFSIIFRGAQTLDLMATSLQTRDDMCDALDRILEAYQGAKERVASDVRLLRFVWLNVVASANGNTNNGSGGDASDSGSTDFVNVNQIARVFSQINFFMKPKDVQANYEKFGKVIGLDRSKRRRGLTFGQLADFLHYIRRNSWLVKPVTSIWNGLFGELMNNGKKRETVSDQTFLKRFLHKKQGQEDATLEQVRELFAALHDMEISHNNRNTSNNPQCRDVSENGNRSPKMSNSRHGGATSTEQRRDLTRINKDQFEAYLLANENDAFDPEREKLDMAIMDKPLSEYFINSSHNTYLIGDQYTSHSRVEMYSNALYRGCRCLELDIWDGGKSNDGKPIPVVWHGHTMTSKILFKDIIRTIKVFLNFHPDSFPIVLSFENHCTVPYQKEMARQLVDILGDSLYIPTENSLLGTLPSPAQLRGRVVIKGRRPTRLNDHHSAPPAAEKGSNTSASSAVNAALESEDILEDEAFHNSGVTALSMTGTEDYDDSEEEEDEDEEEGDDAYSEIDALGTSASVDGADPPLPGVVMELKSTPVHEKQTQPKKRTRQRAARKEKTNQHHRVAPELARLTTLHGTKFKSWHESNRAPAFHMHSFSESKVRNKLRRGYNKQDWIIYNQTHMSRTYPAGARVDSSNYNPLLGWSSGCQMVALNFQTEDACLRLNDGRFRENGNCGYVLKPSSLMILSGTQRQQATRIEETDDDDGRDEEQEDEGTHISEPPLSKESGDSDDIPDVHAPMLEENSSALESGDVLNTQGSSLGNSEDDDTLAGTKIVDDNRAEKEDVVEVEDDDEHGIEVPVNGLLSSHPATRLSVQVLSGSCLPKPKGQRNGDCIDPYVKLSVFDVTEEGKENLTEYSTSVVRLNGFSPIWGQEKHIFMIENAAVSMLQLTVFDKNTSKVTSKADEFIASCSIPISCLRKGIRSVKLYDATNTRSGAFDFASLLLDIGIRQCTAEI
mmetsp:Transcript_10055/g.22037  ORF Transcript_10055/g.22037 Transcript_10055/m.22037 type:complete len:1175 (+) Transcript_10055:169-3693(+)